MSFELKLITTIIIILFIAFLKGFINLNNTKNLNFENKGEEIAYYAFRGYDCDNFWKSDSLCFYGIQPYIVECHYRSNLYNFPTNYDKMINEGLKIPFNDIKNGDLVLFKKGSFELKESYGIFKDGFVYYKTDIGRAKREEIKKLENIIEGIRRYW
jgi:hypothetical protein